MVRPNINDHEIYSYLLLLSSYYKNFMKKTGVLFDSTAIVIRVEAITLNPNIYFMSRRGNTYNLWRCL